MGRFVAISCLLLIALGAVVIAVCAPYLYPEYQLLAHGKEPAILAPPSVPVTGRWFDDYFVIETIDEGTFAIGEPRYYQGNYSYLLLGKERAILFDAGSGTRDIVPVVRSLTTLPVTVVPSHLHFDHVGALGHFERTALLDDSGLRSRVRDGRLTLRRYEFLGFLEGLKSPTFRIDDWWAAGSRVDLGGREVRVMATPGHTPTSISLYEERRRQLFVGDFIYPAELYAFLPGASRSTYLETTRRLLEQLDPRTRIFAAHMPEPPAPVRAPELNISDLQALEQALRGIRAGSLKPVPAGALPTTLNFPRLYPVRGAISFATGYPWNNR
jgi:hydroxyacylglutathione hydrolase